MLWELIMERSWLLLNVSIVECEATEANYYTDNAISNKNVTGLNFE